MPSLTARTRVSELLAGRPAAIETLRSTGVYRDGDDPSLTIGQLGWMRGFNPGILLMILASAPPAPAAPAPDLSRYQRMPLADLVDHILATHHAYLRAELPRLLRLAGQLAGTPADVEFGETLRGFAAELDAHLRHEEQALFPMVLDLAGGGAVSPTPCGSAVGGPIACMETDHERSARGLERLGELAGGHAGPAPDEPVRRELLAALARLDTDLREHICKENEVLFPRALAAQRAGAG